MQYFIALLRPLLVTAISLTSIALVHDGLEGKIQVRFSFGNRDHYYYRDNYRRDHRQHYRHNRNGPYYFIGNRNGRVRFYFNTRGSNYRNYRYQGDRYYYYYDPYYDRYYYNEW